MGSVIRATGLAKRYGRLTAVEGLDLDVREGEVFGFLGPNGAGKTTTLRLLCALIAPTAGTAEIAGHRLGRDDRAIRASVGILTEQPGLYERHSAWDNLAFFAALHGLRGDVARRSIERYLRLLDLWDRRDDPVATFSRGLKQKVAIARAAIHEPRIVFLDEPTTGLDPDAARTVRGFIDLVRSEGRTVFLCTHNLDDADRLCDRIAFFRRRVLRLDTPAALRRELYGEATVVRIAGGPRHGDLERVQAVPGVRSVDRDDGTLVVTSDEPDRTTPLVVRTLVEAGAALTQVAERQVPLEDVYRRVIGGVD